MKRIVDDLTLAKIKAWANENRELCENLSVPQVKERVEDRFDCEGISDSTIRGILTRQGINFRRVRKAKNAEPVAEPRVEADLMLPEDSLQAFNMRLSLLADWCKNVGGEVGLMARQEDLLRVEELVTKLGRDAAARHEETRCRLSDLFGRIRVIEERVTETIDNQLAISRYLFKGEGAGEADPGESVAADLACDAFREDRAFER